MTIKQARSLTKGQLIRYTGRDNRRYIKPGVAYKLTRDGLDADNDVRVQDDYTGPDNQSISYIWYKHVELVAIGTIDILSGRRVTI